VSFFSWGNSGKSKGEKNIEDTAFKTNMEAAAEVARQLRVRDLGGLIVIDLIDMRQKGHISEVEKMLKNSLKRDKAKIDVGRISKFGLLEMSRQRIKSSLIEKSFVACPHCGGSGTIKSIESNAVYLLRKIHDAAIGPEVVKVDMLLPSEVANYLNNRKRWELLKIEKDCDVKLDVSGQSGIPVNNFNLEVTKKYREAEPEKEGPDKEITTPENKEHKPSRRPAGRGRNPGGHRQNNAPKEPEPAAAAPEKEEEKGLLSRIKSAIGGK